MSTPQNPDDIDFTALFAAQIHDLKNLLFVLLGNLDQAIGECGQGAAPEAQARLARLKYNGQLINDKLVQMLSLYRVSQQDYPLDIAYRPVSELIEDAVAESRPLLDTKSIAISSEVDPALCWFYDRDLAAGVLSNAIHNALHCARSQIRLSAAEQNGFLAIRIEDDGAGFPAEVLETGGSAKGLDRSANKTGLGLYFSTVCARLHRNKDKVGKIELGNGGSLGGAVLTLWLP